MLTIWIIGLCRYTWKYFRANGGWKQNIHNYLTYFISMHRTQKCNGNIPLLILSIRTWTNVNFQHSNILNFQFWMFKCLLTPTQWVFNSLINLCSDNFMLKTSNRYLPLLTYSNKETLCINFTHKSGINTTNECLETKIWMLHKWTNIQMSQHLFVPYYL